MNHRLEIFFLSLILGTCSIIAHSQATARAPQSNAAVPKTPALKLKIVPSKETFTLNEKVFTKSELTNLTEKTLCFPNPALDCEDTNSGSLITTGEAVASGEGEQFICHIDGRSATREQLLHEIEEKWVKVAPGVVYTTKTSEAQVSLGALGQWRLKASYNPPQASFGNAKEFNALLQSAAQSFGCVVPEDVVAEPILITVIPPPDPQ